MAKLVCYMDYQKNDKKKHYRVRVVDLDSSWGIDKSISFKDKNAYIGELGHLNRKHLDSLCKNIF